MISTPRAPRFLFRTALATCLSTGVLTLVGCVSQPVNTNARNTDLSIHAQTDFDKQQKDPVITPDTFYAAGQLAESQEMWDKAIAQYNKALKINKDHLPSLYRLGIIYAKAKQYPQAIVIWKHYLTATGGDSTAWANVGFCYELSGNFEDAENSYEAGIRRDPNSAPCRVNYGLMLARRGRFNQAMHEWQMVLPPAEVYYNMGSAYEAADRKEQAKAEFRRALTLDPQLADARARLERLGEKAPAFTPPTVAKGPEAPEVPAADPTTAPAEAPVAATPDTQPAADAAVPTTAPSLATGQAPSTQPIASIQVPTTAPSTQPMVSTDAPTTAPVSDINVGDHQQVDVPDPGQN